MGVYIKGMETPKKCSGCVMRVDNPDIGMRCRITGNDIDTLTFWHGSLSDCPLVEVKTPHGRLIDADALIVKHESAKRKDIRDWDFHARAQNWIIDAPTVVEAEGKDDG